MRESGGGERARARERSNTFIRKKFLVVIVFIAIQRSDTTTMNKI